MTQGTVIVDKDKNRITASKMLIGVFYRVDGGNNHNTIACRINDDVICYWVECDGFRLFNRNSVAQSASQLFVEVDSFVYSSGEPVNEE